MGVVVPFGDKEGGRASLAPLLKLVSDDMEKINETILAHAHSHVDMIPELAGHLINSGGKRLRPMLTIASALMFGYRGEKHIPLATAVEFMHTATLLHDDVVDESDYRRGRKAARLIWGNQASVLVGDYLLGQAFKMLVDTGLMEALRIMSNAAAVIAPSTTPASRTSSARRWATTSGRARSRCPWCSPTGAERMMSGPSGSGSWRTATRRTAIWSMRWSSWSAIRPSPTP